MILLLVITSLLLVTCFIFIFSCAKSKDWGDMGFSIFLALVCGLVLFIDLSAMSHDNKENVEYRFPADNYQFFEEVTVSYKTVSTNGVLVVTETRDTTYVLVGEEPIIINSNRYERNVLGYE